MALISEMASSGTWWQEGQRKELPDVFAICWIPHDSHERMNWSCILSGLNAADRVRELQWVLHEVSRHASSYPE